MSNRTKALLAVLALVTSYGFGRWSAPEKIHTEIKTVEVEKKTNDTDTNRDKHQKTTVTETDSPDGTKTKTTVTTVDTDTDRKTRSTDDTSKTSDTVKDVTYASAKTTLAALVGASLSLSGTDPLVYGGIVSKPILGPITVGIWGLSNSTGGLAVGLTF